MFGLAPSATEEGAKCPQKAPPSPPQELKSTIHHKINTPIDFKDYKYVLIELNTLHTTCNSNVLLHNYVEVLSNFSSLENV